MPPALTLVTCSYLEFFCPICGEVATRAEAKLEIYISSLRASSLVATSPADWAEKPRYEQAKVSGQVASQTSAFLLISKLQAVFLCIPNFVVD